MGKAIATVRFSLQSDPKVQARINKALVGHSTKAIATGPFKRLGTACYVAAKTDVLRAINAIGRMMRILKREHLSLDHVIVTLALHNPVPASMRKAMKEFGIA